MHRNKSVNVHQFAMVPRPDIPRSSFRITRGLKTCFDAGYLVPIYVDEVLPGDTFNLRMTAFGRLATPIFPVLDNIHLETFFFFVPNRLLWSNWKKFMGEQANPADSISYVIPKVTCPANGFVVGSLFDFFGLPTVGQVTAGQGGNIQISALPLRAYNLIYNEWFRDENLQNSLTVPLTDGPDATATYNLVRRGKRPDYFTTCLPWVQKGSTSVPFLAGSAPVKTNATDLVTGAQSALRHLYTTGATPGASLVFGTGAGGNPSAVGGTAAGGNVSTYYPSNLYADLAATTGATINQLRQSFQIQRLLERDARGGTRYTEMVRAHFGVISPDARQQRPEYLGGGSTPININPVPQTSVTAATPQGNLAAFGTALASQHGFTASFTEHGYIIGLANVRADLTYQQGLHRMWSRNTRYDFYFPAFANLGEQAVLNKEIYVTGTTAQDDATFGFQERWGEYRYGQSQVTNLFRSTSAGTIDPWHLAQRFSALPTLNATFIEDTPPLSRILAVGAGANGQQILLDCFYDIKAARPMPLYSVPGLIDHF